MFFLDSFILSHVLYKLVEETWQNGFVKAGDNLGLVNSSKGISYVTKYISKDMYFEDTRTEVLADIIIKKYSLTNVLQKHGFMSLLRFEDGKFKLVPSSDSERPLCEAILKRCRSLLARLRPFHLQSTKLGSCWLEKQSFPPDYVLIHSADGVFKHYNLPRYYERFFYYDCIENEIDGKRTKFVLNEAGKHRRLQNLEKQIQEKICTYNSAIAQYSSINSDMLAYVNSSCEKLFFESVDSLKYYISNIDLDLRIMAIYDVVFRGRLNTLRGLTLTDTLVSDNYYDYFAACLSDVHDLDFGRIYERDRFLDRKYLERLLWDKHEFFFPYEVCLQVLQGITIFLRKSTSLSALTDERLIAKVREHYKTINP